MQSIHNGTLTNAPLITENALRGKLWQLSPWPDFWWSLHWDEPYRRDTFPDQLESCKYLSKYFWAASIFFSTSFLLAVCSVSLALTAFCNFWVWACNSRICLLRGSVSCWWSWLNRERSAFRVSTICWSLALVFTLSWLTWSSNILTSLLAWLCLSDLKLYGINEEFRLQQGKASK